MTWLQRYRLRHLLRFAFWSVPVGWMMAALIAVRAVIMRMEASGLMSADLPIDLRANRAFGDSQVEVGLQSEPEFGRDTKVFAQSERSVCGDSTLPIDDIADAPGWDSDIPGEPINADAHRLHEFFQKDLPRMNRLEPFLARHISSLRAPNKTC